jgi:hypothetical protein
MWHVLIRKAEAGARGCVWAHAVLLGLVVALLGNAAYASPKGKKSTYETEFEARRAELLETYATSPVFEPYNEMARLETDRPLDELGIRPYLLKLDNREDCADFFLHGILWILYKYGDHPGINPVLLSRMRESVLNFKYWPDEGGEDGLCTWTENHMILFSSAAYLAGQRYPSEIFPNSGWRGRDQMDRHRNRILRWLDFRFRTGFWEFLSNVYYEQDLTALLSLIEWCEDEEIARRAAMVADTLCLDMALNSYQGVFGSAHGRSYEAYQKWGHREETTAIQWLLFGQGDKKNRGMASTLLALSDQYRVPKVIYQIARDNAPQMRNRQTMGIRIEDGPQWGLGYESFEDGMFWLSMGAYGHPLTVELFVDMLAGYNWWENALFAPFAEYRELLETLRAAGTLPNFVDMFKHDVQRSVLEQAEIHTYRTPDYMLSSVPAYRAGYGGAQQHVWQATLGPNAVCFTTHPAAYTGDEPGYWTGNGWMPYVAQHDNVAIIIYNAVDRTGLYFSETLDFTHAWLPKDLFDEVVEEAGWVFARSGDGYLALRSQHPYTWQEAPGEDQDREMIVPGRQNIYICELGRSAVNGSFAQFRESIRNAYLEFDGLSVVYQSPSQGHLQAAWSSEIMKQQENKALPPVRYSNPYVTAAFPSNTILAQHGGEVLWLDWPNAIRAFEYMPPEPVPVAGVFGAAAAMVLIAFTGIRLRRR